MKHGIFELFCFIWLLISFQMLLAIILVVSLLRVVAGSVDRDRSGGETGMELNSYPRTGFMCLIVKKF